MLSPTLGVKVYDGQYVKAGVALVVQTAAKWQAGENVRYGATYNLYAVVSGVVNISHTTLSVIP
jgi:ribosomal protein L27